MLLQGSRTAHIQPNFYNKRWSSLLVGGRPSMISHFEHRIGEFRKYCLKVIINCWLMLMRKSNLSLKTFNKKKIFHWISYISLIISIQLSRYETKLFHYDLNQNISSGDQIKNKTIPPTLISYGEKALVRDYGMFLGTGK